MINLENRKKVVIIGGGFGGLNVAKSLAHAPVDILLIDKTNHHLFQPLLYQIATAALAPRDIAVPIREVLKHQPNVSVMLGEVVAIAVDAKQVLLANGEKIPFDYLVVAPGSRHFYYGHDEWERVAPGLKTLRDALTIRENILLAFERAETSHDPFTQARFMNFAVVGGGPTGVEMAGAIAEIARKTMLKNFRKINPHKTRVYLIEAGPRILAGFPEDLSASAQKALEEMGVEVLTNSPVTAVGEDFVQLKDQRLDVGTTIWAAGNIAAPILKTLGAPVDKQGRVLVEPDLSLPGHPDIFVIGDAAHVKDESGQILAGMAPIAIQEAKYVASLIKDDKPKDGRSPFHYRDRGAMATIGKAKAIVWIGKVRLAGFFAWLFWCLVHIAYLIGFRNRFFVMLEWFYWYITGNRSSRLIYYRQLGAPKEQSKEQSSSSQSKIAP